MKSYTEACNQAKALPEATHLQLARCGSWLVLDMLGCSR